MAKIGIYSDVHISHNSSILPTYLKNYEDNDIRNEYTQRLNMCRDSMIWAYNQFAHSGVDIIVNCGDTFNSHTITSDESKTLIDTILNIYNPKDSSKFTPLLDVTLVGNHDKFNDTFNSLAPLGLTDYTILIDAKPLSYELDDCILFFIGYCNTEEFISKITELLEPYSDSDKRKILFMHGDINGSSLTGNKKIENHIPKDFLYDRFDVVFNGHIHNYEVLYNKDGKEIYNIGSLTTHSFADNNEHIGKCFVYDTESKKLFQFLNPYSILFRTYEISKETLNHLMLDLRESEYKYVLKIKTIIDLKDDIEKILKSLNNVLKYKFVFNYNNTLKDSNNTLDDESKKVDINSDSIEDQFINFLSNRDDLKGNIDTYKKIVEDKVEC